MPPRTVRTSGSTTPIEVSRYGKHHALAGTALARCCTAKTGERASHRWSKLSTLPCADLVRAANASRRPVPVPYPAQDLMSETSPRLFIVSPHFDDAVFGCGAL